MFEPKMSTADRVTDGQLFNVSRLARGAGFASLPVFISEAVSLYVVFDYDPSKRLEKVLIMLRHAYAALFRERGGAVEFLFDGAILRLSLESAPRGALAAVISSKAWD